MKPPAAISTYMRKLQRKSASKRWAGLTPEQRKEQMSAVAKARWAANKPKGVNKERKETI